MSRLLLLGGVTEALALARRLGPAHVYSLAGLGSLSFETSCAPAVQKQFVRGVALLHSFWYSEGEKTFREILQQEPTCTIAAWGYAAILMSNPLAGVGASPKGAAAAIAALDWATSWVEASWPTSSPGVCGGL